MKNLISLLLTIVIASSCSGKNPKTSEENQNTKFWQQAKTPPMGWNSWDCYGPTVTETEIRTNADYMASHLKQHGWEYIVVDIRWFVENDKAVDTTKLIPFLRWINLAALCRLSRNFLRLPMEMALKL